MFVTEEQFNQLKQRYNDYKDKGFPDIDQRMIRIVTSLNEIEGIVTVFCCEGHYEQTQAWQDKLLLNMHVIMGVRDIAGLQILYSVIERVNQQLRSPFGMELRISQLSWPFDEGRYNYYPVICLEKNYRIPRKEAENPVKLKYLAALSTAIDFVKG